MVGTSRITKTKLEVPYSIVGDYVYESGFRVAGTRERHVHRHRTATTSRSGSQEFNLDGTPAAKPAPQPQATLLQQS